MAVEDTHFELQEPLNPAFVAVKQIQNLLARLVSRLTSLDGLEYSDHKISDHNRII